MDAASAVGRDESISLHSLRPLVGGEVTADTTAGRVEGTLVSCTSSSAWIVAGDVDHLVALAHLQHIRPR